LWHWSLNSLTSNESAKQTLCHLSHISRPFCSGYFGDGLPISLTPNHTPDP
jgi:hypothetical protein